MGISQKGRRSEYLNLSMRREPSYSLLCLAALLSDWTRCYRVVVFVRQCVVLLWMACLVYAPLYTRLS